jgi:putative endonuclease
MTNRPNGVLYIGVTADLIRRVYEHRTGAVKSFSKKYNLERLVYFERHEEILLAIAREKAMKKWRREWKVELIEKTNPGWNDLYDQIA